MARAKVELMGALTHSGRGRSFERGKPQILTGASEIAYYKAQSEFSVTILAEPVPVAPPKVAMRPGVAPSRVVPRPAVAAKVTPKAVAVAVEGEPEDTGEDAEEGAEGGAEGEGEEGAAEELEANPVLKKAQLEAMTKAALVEVGKDSFGLVLNVDWAKPKLVGEILKAQIAAAS